MIKIKNKQLKCTGTRWRRTKIIHTERGEGRKPGGRAEEGKGMKKCESEEMSKGVGAWVDQKKRRKVQKWELLL